MLGTLVSSTTYSRLVSSEHEYIAEKVTIIKILSCIRFIQALCSVYFVFFQYNIFKTRLLNERVKTPTTTVYKCGPLIDLCRGPHVRHTGKVKSFMVTKVSHQTKNKRSIYSEVRNNELIFQRKRKWN